MGRTTVNVEWLKERVNYALENSTTEPDVRRGMLSVLEHVLFAARQYKGFVYLESAGPQEPNTGRFYDETRRRYL